MEEIYEVNWNKFRAKFNGKEQKSFETLCYLLFCSEFEQKQGIFRYKNQTGIETEPIQRDGETIAWQAKFWETSISTNKDELRQSVESTKRKNPAVTKILFYLNQEFSESSQKDKKDPAYKTEIEDYAKSLGVKIEWRVPSHFERQLALENNRRIAQHFFSLGKSIVDFVKELREHTGSILAPIHSQIIFQDKEIKIDRSDTLRNLQNALATSSLVILSGEGGTGKTAVVKDLYEELRESSPFFIFKASELNISNVNDHFKHYGPFAFADFLEEHEGAKEKYIVIDSAEKLSDIEDQTAFHEFLSRLFESGWKIIFTTRHGYLDDLKWQLVDIYKRSFDVVNIENITRKDLYFLGTQYGFNLPQSQRLPELLLKPFYLNEYLQNYKEAEESKTYSEFKKLIWNKKIQNSMYQKNNIHLEREYCFLEIAKTRANSGLFYVSAGGLNGEALRALESDEIIKYDPENGGYFITHDTYEEWALDGIIEREFNRAGSCKQFFDLLGSSLPIRRAFRVWLSEQLLVNPAEVKSLVEESINNDQIQHFWKDEALISVLLSDYSEPFFQAFEKKLLENNENLLRRVIFLLRIACKGIDEATLRLLGLHYAEGITLQSVFTLPKGKGWELTTDFIHRHKAEFELRNMHIVLPLLQDWNNKNKQGETTRKASQIGLYYYDEIFGEDKRYAYQDDTASQLVNVILQGAQEIKEELTAIFTKIVSQGKSSHRDKYYVLVKAILTSMIDCFEVVKALPEEVIKLADLYWFEMPDRESRYHRMGVEQDFCIAENYEFKYFPASALQTPTYQLLRFAHRATLPFIVSFTNRAVECFAKSEMGKHEVEKVTVLLDEPLPVEQCICNRLWNTYRGTQVSTSLLESIHMALEKWLLEQAKSASPEALESVCKYLLRNSKSASITAIVASLVMAQPTKLFNIAKIFFRAKEFFQYDSARLVLDQSHKAELLSLKKFFPGFRDCQKEIYEDERIKACDDEHRKLSLEHIAFQYQFVKAENNPHFEKQREALWEIWDDYYQKLPPEAVQSEEDKTWRLFLARMDTRKMTFKTEPAKDGDKILITFNPEIDPALRKYSEDSLQRINESWKHMALRLWAEYRFKGEEDKYKHYEQYEKNPHAVIAEAQEITDELAKESGGDSLIFDRSIPAYACAVLVRDLPDTLTDEERAFCKEVLVRFASIPISSGKYSYQISDGVEPAIGSLPRLMKLFPNEKKAIKRLLFLLLLNLWKEISIFAIRAILSELWAIDPEEAQSIFLGYLMLRPKYKALIKEIRKANYDKGVYEFSDRQLVEVILERYEKELELVISNKITWADVGDLNKLSLDTLNTAFELLPQRTENESHKTFIITILPVIAKRILEDDRRDEKEKVDYELKKRFLNKLAYFTLTSKPEDIPGYMKPFVDNFRDSQNMADFFHEFVSVEDKLAQYEEFWTVWALFYNPIVELCKKNYFRYHAKQIVHNYLLAWPWWKETAREWHSLKERERSFFGKVAQDIGKYPAVLYSLAKIVNDIGSNFLEDGVFWISGILEQHPDLVSAELDTDTVFYIENLIRRYAITNRQKIKRTNKIKLAVIVILNFLVEKGSITGYLLREDIL